MNYIDFVKLWEMHSQAPSLIAGDKQITYHALHLKVVSKIDELKKAGISSGDRVALFGTTSISYIINLLSLLHMDVIAIPLSIRHTETQVHERLKQSGCVKIIAQESSMNFKFSSRVNVFDMEEGEFSNHYMQLAQLPLTQPATIIFTSGSSGSPKAVLHTIGNHYFSALGSAENIPLKPGDRWLVTLPLYHVGGLAIIFRTLLAGATAVILQDDLSLSENLRLSAISHISLVPTQLVKLIEEETDFPALKAVLLGGAAISPEIVRRALQARLPLYLSYGSTEMASQITTTHADDPARLDGTSGYILNYRSLTIAQDNEILVKGLTLSPGYLEGDQIYPLIDDDGWFHTGDLGIIDSLGRLRIIGRKDNMFISGGENIYPEEIESVLLSHPGIMDAIVVEIPDEKFGFRPVAFLSLKEGLKIDEKDVSRFLSDKIERFKIPLQLLSWPGIGNDLKPSREQFRKIARQQINETNSTE